MPESTPLPLLNTETKTGNINEKTGSSDKFSIKPNKALLATITLGSFAMLTILMVFSGNQDALALDEEKLLVMQQAKVEVSTIALQSSYLKPRVVYGQIESVQQSDVGFELSGTLLDLNVTEGQQVEKGEVLAALDVARLQARANELKSALASAQANANLARLSAKRIELLVSKKLEPQQRLDEARAQLDVTNAAASEVQARLDSLTVELAKSSLVAPFAGQIVEQFLDAGTVVNAGQAVFSILAKESLEARFGLPDTTAFGLKVGETRALAMQGETFVAQLVSIAKQRNQSTRTIDALFSVDVAQLSPKQSALVVSGDLVSLTVDIPLQTSGAWVPISALASGVRGLWTLYVVGDNNTIETRMVSIEYADSHAAFVSGAISNGDKLVVSGIHRLSENQRVNNVVEVNMLALQSSTLSER